MTLEEIMKMWEQDSIIESLEIGEEAIKTSKLHAKYMKHLSNAKLSASYYMKKYKEKREWKRRYFKGEFNNPADLAKYGIEPYKGMIVNAEMQVVLDADQELNELLLKKEYHEVIAQHCESIIRELNNRTYAIGNAIKWNIFTGGG